MFGVNLSGAEFGWGKKYGYDYIYPNESLDYYDSKGLDLIRLPFKWERMQTEPGGPLNQAELDRMIAFLDDAAERGMHVIIDMHNYGRFGGQVIGSDAVPVAAFQDVWTKLATALEGHPGLAGYDIMNEPHDMGGPDAWRDIAQATVDAIRTVDTATAIYVEGTAWSSAHTWMSFNANLLIDDPSNNIIYEAHLYLDRNASGTYQGSYDQERAYPNIGVDRLQPFIQWLEEHNLQGFIGEFGVPNTDPRWLTVLDNAIAEMREHGLSGTIWGGGPWWGDYPLSVEPVNGQDAPQLDVIEKYGDPTVLIEGTSGPDTLYGTQKGEHFVLGAGNDFVEGRGLTDRIDGQDGTDTASYLHSPAAVDIDLLRAYQLGGDAENDQLISVENIWGSSFGDRLVGDAARNLLSGGSGNDVLIGGANADRLEGGAGFDTVSYADSPTGVIVTLTAASQSRGDAAGDVLVGVEGIIGTPFADTINGDGEANQISGGAGDDVLTGRGGYDSIDGGAGSDTVTYQLSPAGVKVDLLGTTQIGADAQGDTLVGIERLIGSNFGDTLQADAANNNLSGLAGDDILEGRGGADPIDGGAGIDTASYASSTAGVIVDLGLGARPQSGGDANGDILNNIENITGSVSDDVLKGSTVANVLRGGDGNDQIEGRGGADTLSGGRGADVFVFRQAGDISDPTSGSHDTVIGFSSDEDRFDFSGIDARTSTPANDAFTFIGSAPFTGHEGELAVSYYFDASITVIEGDTNGDAMGDFKLVLSGVHPLTAGNFLL